MQDTIPQPPPDAAEVERLRELVYDQGDVIAGLVGQVAELRLRLAAAEEEHRQDKALLVTRGVLPVPRAVASAPARAGGLRVLPGGAR